MIPTYLTKFGTVAAAAALAVSLAPTDADAQERVRWKLHSAYGTNLAVLGPVPGRIAEMVSKMSGGKFDIKVFEPGALVGGNAYYDPVSQGAFEIAYGTPGYHQGRDSTYNLFSSWPFGPGVGAYLAWFKHGGGYELARELYAKDNIKFFMCGMIPPETSGWFRDEITSLDQLKGLKMRFFGMGALVMQKFGVSTQLLAAGDIYPALELGTIDATEFSMPAIDRSLGFYQIAKYNYFPGWHQQATTNEFLINMDAWNALSPEYQAMFETACDANFTAEFAEGENLQYQAMLDNEADGVENKTWPPEILDQLRAAWDEVNAEEIAKNPLYAKVWESWATFEEKYRVWGDRGYLK
ncbi:TRAP transporter substrate-binding protein [Pikeienuella piscinae]|uniref:TRAP transporter substrate-binding protein n=1 Tax=Pikeienuella piscinae TaxID=2748098 RepID=A0A7L5BWM7_9RHOB|nr:TRAP transporter substrate-binding protein [Pikeienuella piscinae]QIE55851.1 TRAP transporter substrate-binding protein [Pikeienuella piscinae]